MTKFNVGGVPGNPACIYDEKQRPLGECVNVITAEVICGTLNRYLAAFEKIVALEDSECGEPLDDAIAIARKILAE